MDRTDELIELIYNAQKEKEEQDKIIETAKGKSDELDSKIKLLKDELFNLIQDKEPHKKGKMIAVKMQKIGTGYKDEAAIIKWLKENLGGQFIKSKTTESLDKNPFKKELKTNNILTEGVKDYITPTVTEYIVVTDEENYQKMLEHINEGK